jgi:hypothetical protein
MENSSPAKNNLQMSDYIISLRSPENTHIA